MSCQKLEAFSQIFYAKEGKEALKAKTHRKGFFRMDCRLEWQHTFQRKAFMFT